QQALPVMNIATLRFTPADQQAFARLSGDFNPIHLDPVAARLVAAGAPIVHGVNLLLRALDAHFKDRVHAGRSVVTATFRRPALPPLPPSPQSHGLSAWSVRDAMR